MSRKTIIISLIVGLVIILGAVSAYFYFRTTPDATLTTATDGTSPFGDGGGSLSPGTPQTSAVGQGTGLDQNGKPLSKLFRITDQPVAGEVAFIKNGFVVIRYVDRATGHIYDVNPVTLEKVQITNNTYPKTYEAYFKKDASSVLIRGLMGGGDVIENTVLTLTPPKASSTDNLYKVSASILAGNIGVMTIMPDNSLVYATKDTGALVKSGFSGDKASTLFSSAFTDWQLASLGPSNVSMTTNASAGVDGFSYDLNTKTGGLSKILGPLKALTVTPSLDGKRIAYSYINGGTLTLQVKNNSTKVVSDVLPATFSEKCVWSIKSQGMLYCGVPSGVINANEPDSWYQGATHFSDTLWRFDINTGFTDVLAEPKKSFNVDLDVENPTLTPDEDYLVFRNKSDLTLWVLKLD